MKIYTFHGAGLALGSVIVVVAQRRDQALRLAKVWANDNGLDPESLQLASVEKVDGPAVACGWNGDY